MRATTRVAVRGASILLAAWLAACAATEPPAPPSVAPTTVAIVPPAPAPPAARPPVPARKPAVPASVAATPSAAAPPAPQIADFEHLHGLDTAETLELLGEPQQRTEAPPAVMWRYIGSSCELDVYFYRDLDSQELRVLHYEVNSRDGIDRPEQHCYAELASAHQSGAEPDGSTGRPR
jgi:hypothetical protein